MKEKIILFVIGVLLGAVIATGTFYVYSVTAKSCDCNNAVTQMNGGQPPEMPNGQNGGPPEMPSGENGQPPEKPSDDNGQPPEMPNENNN